MKSLDFKFMNLKNAYEKLKSACDRFDGNEEIVRDGLIQRFEFTYELCHKTLFEFMKFQGIAPENSFPRTIFKKAYACGLISDDLLWINLMEDRNCTSHVYDEGMADEIAQRVADEYIIAIGELINKLEDLIKEDL